MSTTAQRLSTTGPLTIPGITALKVATGIQDKDLNPLIPNFVQIDEDCNLKIFAKSSDGSFDVWNPDAFEKTVTWRAHHMHSEEAEPIVTVPESTTPGGAIPDCLVFGGFPLAIAHVVYSNVLDVVIPNALPALTPNLNTVFLDQDAPAPAVSLGAGRIVFNKSGIYRVRASMPFRNVSAGSNLIDLYLIQDPDGTPTTMIPSSSTQGGSTQTNTAEFSLMLGIDESVAVALRTYEVQVISTGTDDVTGNGVHGGTLEVLKVGEKRP